MTERREAPDWVSRRTLLRATLSGVAGVPVAAATASAADSYEAVDDGNWTDGSTWDGGDPPTDGANVFIPEGVTVTVASRVSTRVKYVDVAGGLRFDPAQNSRLRVETIETESGSTFQMGTESTPIEPGVTAEVEFIDEGPIDESRWPARTNKGLIANGDVEIVGAAKTPWTTLAQPPSAGETSVELSSEPTNWSPGDEIVIPGLEAYSSTSLDDNDELRTVASVSGTTVSFDTALDHDHVPPQSDLDVYVANLSRNARFFSESDDVSRYGHFRMGSPGNSVRYLETVQMGRTDKSRDVTAPLWDRGEADPSSPPNPRGRYAIHSHHTGPGNAAQEVVGCAVRNSPGWGIVNHDSNVVATDNVTYRVTGAGIVAEKGSEVGAFKRNLTLRSSGSGEPTESRKAWTNVHPNDFVEPPHNVDDMGHSGHGFWIQSPLVEVEDNVAGGHRHSPFAFWTRALHEQPLERDSSGNFTEYLDGKHDMFPKLRWEWLTDFEKSVAKTGDGGPTVGQKWHNKDSSWVYGTSLPMRSFQNNVAFGCGGGFDLRGGLALRNRQPKLKMRDHGGNTAYNIGNMILDDGSYLGRGNFQSSGNVGLDHRYVSSLRADDYRLVGDGDGVGVFSNYVSYTENYDLVNSTVENWRVGFYPSTWKNYYHYVENNYFNNQIDINIPGRFGKGRIWLNGNTYDGATTLRWQENHRSNIIPQDIILQQSGVHYEGRTVYHGWSDPEFVLVKEGDTDRLDSLMNGGDASDWQEVLDGDDPRDVLPGATHQELYDQYGITFFGGIQDPGQEGFETPSAFTGSGGPYDTQPFLGPAEKTMPTDEIWVDAANEMSFSGDHEIVQYGDGVSNEEPLRVANDQKAVELRADGYNPELPVESTEGVAAYTFSVDTAGDYHVHLRGQQGADCGGANDECSRFYVRIDGGEWKLQDGGNGFAPTDDFVWGDIYGNKDTYTTHSLSTGEHTIEVAGKGSAMRLDWLLVKHETVAANPAGQGKSHTVSDGTAPTAPSNLSSPEHSSTSVDLSWDAASDSGTGVDHYNVYVDGSKQTESSDTTETVSGLKGGTTYDFSVTAVDGAGNESGESNIISVSTDSDSSPGEVNTVQFDMQGRDDWRSATFEGSYEDPIVVMQTPSFNGSQPVHCRLRNVTSDGFEYRMEEWNYMDNSHVTETVSYLVVERGIHTLDDGTTIEADSVSTNTGWANVSLSGSFDGGPVVLPSVQTFNGPDAVITRQKDISGSGFEVRLQEEEAESWHTTEEIGYVALGTGTGTVGGGDFEVGTVSDVTHEWTGVDFVTTFDAAPQLLAAQQTYNGANTANVRHRNLDDGSTEFHIDEEQSGDEETWHVAEEVGYALFEDSTSAL